MFTPSNKTSLYQASRETCALLAGLYAIASRALENGEATQDDLEDIAAAARFLRRHSSAVSSYILELQPPR